MTLLHTEIESDLVTGEHWMLLDGLPVVIAATREQAEAIVAIVVAELRQLPEPVHILAHGYMVLDEQMPVSEVVEKAT